MISLDTVEAAARAGLIDWASVQQCQARAMPRCANHPDRTAWTICNKPLCANCVTALIEKRREQ